MNNELEKKRKKMAKAFHQLEMANFGLTYEEKVDYANEILRRFGFWHIEIVK